jgi:undecaprenyl phosphate-alpha-L-ara4N flippase subunit ArnE
MTSPLLWVGLGVTPFLITAGQVLFKFAGLRLAARDGAGFLRVLIDPYLLAALALYGLGTIIWIYVLRHLALSQAYPVMATTFLLVPLASVLIFGEVLTWRYWLGAGLIVAGMAAIYS